MAVNTPPGGNNYYQGPQDLNGLISAPSPLEDKSAAIARAMSMIGMNPGSFSPMAQAIRKKAGALVNELVLHAAQTGNVDALAAPAQALGMLADLIKSGVGGGAIFGGKGGALSALADIGQKSEGGGAGMSPGEALIAQILGNSANTEQLFLQAKYGGLSDQAQGAMLHSLQGVMDQYQKGLEGGSAAGTNVSGLLRTLLGQPVSSGLGAPSGPGGPSGPGLGGAGAGTPSTATPSVPSALPNPAAGMVPNPAGAMGGFGQGLWGALGGAGMAAALGGQTGNMPPGSAYGPPSPFAGQQTVPPNNSFQPMNPSNYLPEPLATLMRIRQGMGQ